MFDATTFYPTEGTIPTLHGAITAAHHAFLGHDLIEDAQVSPDGTTVALIHDGTAYVVGNTPTGWERTLYTFDPTTHAWIAMSTLTGTHPAADTTHPVSHDIFDWLHPHTEPVLAGAR